MIRILCFAVDPYGARAAVLLHDTVHRQDGRWSAFIGCTARMIVFELRTLFRCEKQTSETFGLYAEYRENSEQQYGGQEPHFAFFCFRVNHPPVHEALS